MSNSGDDRPLAPPRSLGAATGRAPVTEREADESSAAAASRSDVPAEKAAPRADANGLGPSSGRISDKSERTNNARVAGSAYVGGGEPSGAVPAGQPSASAGSTAVSPAPPGGGTSSSSTTTAPLAVDKKAERRAEQAAKRARARQPRRVRRAKLRVVRLDPWSVTKAAFLLSIAFGIMCVVAVFLIFSIMNAAGLWDNVNSTIQGVLKNKPEDAFDIKDYVGMSRIMGITMLISAIDVVIITALATLGAFIYNMAASLLGGIEVTLAEDLK